MKIELVDHQGNLISDANLPLEIKVEGSGSIIASGNASPNDMQSFRSLKPKSFRGKALAIVQPDGKNAGEIKLSVSAEGIKGAQIVITQTP